MTGNLSLLKGNTALNLPTEVDDDMRHFPLQNDLATIKEMLSSVVTISNVQTEVDDDMRHFFLQNTSSASIKEMLSSVVTISNVQTEVDRNLRHFSLQNDLVTIKEASVNLKDNATSNLQIAIDRNLHHCSLHNDSLASIKEFFEHTDLKDNTIKNLTRMINRQLHHMTLQNAPLTSIKKILAQADLKDSIAEIVQTNLQTVADNLRHLLTLQNISPAWLSKFFAHADECAAGNIERALAGKLFVNVFFENSTRTRTSFESAAKQLGADVVNLDQTTMAGESKSESLEDTVRTVAAMGAVGIALRHSQSGAAVLAAKAADEFDIAVINGGTGCESHPTQGLTDAYTLREIFGEDLSALSVAIVGDVLHSRVARSNTQILRAMGVEDIRLIGPPELCPPSLKEEFNAPVFNNLDEGLVDIDVVILLRVQRERFDSCHITTEDYFANYGLSAMRLAKLKAEVVVMHPGPINRGIEISDEVADGKQSKILRQVTNGMAIRKAALLYFCGGG